MPNIEAALAACGTTIFARYSFDETSAAELISLIETLVARHGHFERIAIAPHGPERPPPSPQQGSIAECMPWEISAQVVMSDPVQLVDAAHPVSMVLHALGHATVEGGAVDLLSCTLLGTWACPESAWPRLRGFWEIESTTKCQFAASVHALSGSPLQSEDEWVMDTNEALSIKQAYFLPAQVPHWHKGCLLINGGSIILPPCNRVVSPLADRRQHIPTASMLPPPYYRLLTTASLRTVCRRRTTTCIY